MKRLSSVTASTASHTAWFCVSEIHLPFILIQQWRTSLDLPPMSNRFPPNFEATNQKQATMNIGWISSKFLVHLVSIVAGPLTRSICSSIDFPIILSSCFHTATYICLYTFRAYFYRYEDYKLFDSPRFFLLAHVSRRYFRVSFSLHHIQIDVFSRFLLFYWPDHLWLQRVFLIDWLRSNLSNKHVSMPPSSSPFIQWFNWNIRRIFFHGKQRSINESTGMASNSRISSKTCSACHRLSRLKKRDCAYFQIELQSEFVSVAREDLPRTRENNICWTNRFEPLLVNTVSPAGPYRTVENIFHIEFHSHKLLKTVSSPTWSALSNETSLDQIHLSDPNKLPPLRNHALSRRPQILTWQKLVEIQF